MQRVRNACVFPRDFYVLCSLVPLENNIQIHSSQTSKFLIKYNLLRFLISGGLVIFVTEHDYKVSTSFRKEIKKYK